MSRTSDRHKELGRRIAERRIDLGIASQQEAATLAGVHLNTWNNAERGIAVRPRSMHAIASALRWSPSVPAAILRGGAPQPTQGDPVTVPNPADYGLTPEEAGPLIEQVLDERAELIVDGIMDVIARDPRVAMALARRLERRYGNA
ncbi:helix-turn-helix domain-containing protein [Nonomuraea terrae]|uniref:helix-turn-helix domain-containing protein n=1 Tax=Nonomuraea terrae TaxID=2530383 RepID=UPI0037A9FE66